MIRVFIVLFTSVSFAQSDLSEIPPAPLPPPPPPTNDVQVPVDDEVVEQKSESIDILSDYIPKDSNAKRDPFSDITKKREITSVADSEGDPIVIEDFSVEYLEPKMPLENFPLDQLKLIGVLWRTASPKASFLDPSGAAHIVSKNERIGTKKGYVAAIREGEVVVIEPLVGGLLAYETRILRIEGNIESSSNNSNEENKPPETNPVINSGG